MKRILIFIFLIAFICFSISNADLRTAYGEGVIMVKNPGINNRITESYIVKFTVLPEVNPSEISISFTGKNDALISDDLQINPDGNYQHLISGLKKGPNEIKVIVKEGEGITEEVSVPVTVEPAETNIMEDGENKGPFSADRNQFKNLLKKKNSEASLSAGVAPKSDEYINYFIDTLFTEAQKEKVRADVVFAQMMLETGWLTFTGDVSETQNNFGGIGATGGGVKGNVFPTIDYGIRVNVQHLVAYASDKNLNGETVDPRFKYLEGKRGLTPSVELLGYQENTSGGGWAMSPQYGFILKDLIRTLSEYDSAPFTVSSAQNPDITHLDVHYITVNGINTAVNQNPASQNDTLRAALSANTLVDTDFRITEKNTGKLIAQSGFTDKPYFDFTIPEFGIYELEASVRTRGSSNATDLKRKIIYNIGPTISETDGDSNHDDSSSTSENPEELTAGSRIKLQSPVPVYGTAKDAMDGKGSQKNYEPGEYYIYKVHDGMVNISRQKGSAGGWANPNDFKIDSTAEIEKSNTSITENRGLSTTSNASNTTKLKNEDLSNSSNTSIPDRNDINSGKILLISETFVYQNPEDALNGNNPTAKIPAGYYFVYSEENGMFNISKTPGIKGNWINPEKR